MYKIHVPYKMSHEHVTINKTKMNRIHFESQKERATVEHKTKVNLRYNMSPQRVNVKKIN